MEKRSKNYPNANTEDGVLYLLAEEKLNRAKSSTSHQAHINALGARYLSLEGLILFSKK